MSPRKARALLANVIKYRQVFTKDKHSSLFARSNLDEEKHFMTFSPEYSSIQGVIYIFQANQSLCGRLFWILVVILMLMLGSYWSADAYNSWQDNPVLTTVTTTAYPVTKVTPYKRSSLSTSHYSSMVRWETISKIYNITGSIPSPGKLFYIKKPL